MELIQFVEHSNNLKKIVFHRCNDTPSLTRDIFLMLIKVLQTKQNQETPQIKIYLNSDDYQDVVEDFEWTGTLMMMTEQADLLNVLRLDEEDAITLIDFGNGLGRKLFAGDVFGFDFDDGDPLMDDYDDDDYDDDYYDDDFDDDFDDGM